jgi:hypothetical protein
MNGAMVYRSTDTTADYSSPFVITWDSELYDVGGWHDNVTNNSRLTVPSGVDYVILATTVYLTGVTGGLNPFARFKKNGTQSFSGSVVASTYNDSSLNPRVISLVSPPIPVVAGDYFEVDIDTESDASSTIVASRCSFSIREVAVTSGALVKKSVDQTTANYTTETTLTFDAETYDVGGWHDNSTNNTRLTVPSGVDYVILTGVVVVTSITNGNGVLITIRKNGNEVFDDVRVAARTRVALTGTGLYVVSPAIPVVAGDYFEMLLHISTDTSVTIDSTRTSFSVRAIA